ncbi:PD40 domain-containing protein [Candidatus Poribacteria bacterium]|nr:PD40 domain-containing protein [Candidatus Poribacteria bacterium]
MIWLSLVFALLSTAKVQPPNIELLLTQNITPQTSDIFLLEEPNDEPINLTQNPSSYCPRWSPDGRRIAFLSSDKGRWKICLFDFLADKVRFLTDGTVKGYFDWMPDGRRLIIGYWKTKGFYLLDVDRQNPARRFEELERIPIPHDLTYIYSVACSRDGGKLAYSACVGKFGVSSIYVMDLRDGSVKNLSKISEKPFHANDDSPRWTPDGRFIVFASDRDTNRKGDDTYIS